MPYAIQSEIPDDTCAICTDTLKDPSKAVFKLNCGHFFHNDCLHGYCNHKESEIQNPFFQSEEELQAAYGTQCPMCRAPFSAYECTTFDAFATGHLKVNSLPQEVKDIYFTLHPHLAQEHEGGKRKRNKSKRHGKGKKGKGKRKTIRRK